jgi:hypothetical protein
LTPTAFEKAFSAVSAKPTEAFYAQYPATIRTQYELRNGEIVTVKQVYTTQFWKRNEEQSRETDSQRTVIYDRVRRRSVNLLRINRQTGDVEVRIDRVHGQDDTTATAKRVQDQLEQDRRFRRAFGAGARHQRILWHSWCEGRDVHDDR